MANTPLKGIQSRDLIDIKYIQIDKQALMGIVAFQVTGFLCLPLAAYIYDSLVRKQTLRQAIYGKILILSLVFLLEDGPEGGLSKSVVAEIGTSFRELFSLLT